MNLYIGAMLAMMNQNGSYTEAIEIGVKMIGNVDSLDLNDLDPRSDYHNMLRTMFNLSGEPESVYLSITGGQ
jgi:hypothetical protein